MDAFSFEELLRGLSARYERLCQENHALATAAAAAEVTARCGACNGAGSALQSTPRRPVFSSPRLDCGPPRRVERPAAVTDLPNWGLEPVLACNDHCAAKVASFGIQLSPRLHQLTPPADPSFHTLEHFDTSSCETHRYRLSSDQVKDDGLDMSATNVLCTQVHKSVRSSGDLSRHLKQFRRLDQDGAGLLSAPQCLQLMIHLKESGLFLDQLPPLEHVAAAIRRFTSDGPYDTCLPLPIGLTDQDFARLMSQDRRRHTLLPADHNMYTIGVLYDAFRKENQHHLAQETKRALQKAGTSGMEDPKKNFLDLFSAAVILLNAVMIGVSADVLPEDDVWWFIEIGFTVFFTAELIFNMRAVGISKFFTGNDWAWNGFDAMVVSIAIFDLTFTAIYRLFGPDGEGGPDTGSFTIIKLARLGRIARLVRVLRFKIFNELKMMIQGVIAGLRVLFWAIVLLFFFIYVLGVLMRKTLGDAEHPDHEYARHKSFETVSRAMFTLFRCFTDGCTSYDGTPLQSHLFDYYGFAFMFGYMLVYMFVTIGIFNLIMAIFIDNVMEASIQRKKQELGGTAERMECKLKELIEKLSTRKKTMAAGLFNGMMSGVTSKCMEVVMSKEAKLQASQRRSQKADEAMQSLREEDLVISKALFMAWISEPEMAGMLADLDITVANKGDLFDVLDCDLSGELEVAELIEGLMRLRGPADKSDAVATLLGVRHLTKMMEEVNENLRMTKDRLSQALMSKDGWSER